MRHHKKPPILPSWYAREASPCVRSVIEDAYTARELALELGAFDSLKCRELISAAEKSLAVLRNRKNGEGKRCKEGDRAARKFWEAKVCARR